MIRKRWIQSGLLLCMAIGLFVCSYDMTAKGIPARPAIENEQEIVRVIRETLQHRSWRVRVRFSAYAADRDTAEALAGELMEQAFYESDDPCGGDYLRFQYGGYELGCDTQRHLLRTDYQLRIVPRYYTTAEQEEEVDDEVLRIIDAFAFSADSSDYEKLCAVRDYICQTVTYDTVHKHTPGSAHIQSTAYGALRYRTALCQGYAVLCYRLLKELGVDVRIVTGEANVSGEPERHAWNLVKLDGKYYNMDVTLDDARGNADCFLKSDETFARDHLRDAQYRTEEFYRKYPMASADYRMP